MKQETIERIRKFSEERDWDQFHSPENLADKLGLDPDEIVNMKMAQNEAKYPVEKAKGKADKYDKL